MNTPDMDLETKPERVARLMLAMILDGEKGPGASLGTEQELLVHFGVSRPTMRESLRILQSHGVIDLRSGPGGGIVVRLPNINILAQGLSVFLKMHNVPLLKIVEAREVIEPALASEAARNGTEEDFADLAASIERMTLIQGDHEAFVAENAVFHSLIARASGNKVLESFWTVFSMLGSGEHEGIRFSAENQAHVIAFHQRILDACVQRDAREAAQQMEAHVHELERLVLSRRGRQTKSGGSGTPKKRGSEVRRYAGT